MASVRRRDPSDPTSPWVVEYTDPAGKRRRATPKSGLKKDADALRKKIEREIGDGLHTPAAETMTVREVADLWLKANEDKVRCGDIGQRTLNNFKSIVDKSIVPAFGAKPIAALNFVEIEAFHSKLIRRVKPVTAKNHMMALKQIEDFANQRGLTKKGVAGEVLRDVGYAKKIPIKTFRMEQVQTLIALAEDVRNRNDRGYLMFRAGVQLAAFCGLRMGEIMGLTLQSVDLEGSVLKIRHSLTQLDELKGPKTKAGNRDVPIPARVRDTLAEWLSRFFAPNDRDLIFRMAKGEMVTRRNFRANYWVPLLQRAGLYDPADCMHFHALRHFAASLMIDLGLPLTDVASLMGHEKFDMTLQVYAHPIVGGNRRHEAFERISAALSPPATRDENAPKQPKLLELKAQHIATA